jgi:hypothetical protein
MAKGDDWGLNPDGSLKWTELQVNEEDTLEEKKRKLQELLAHGYREGASWRELEHMDRRIAGYNLMIMRDENAALKAENAELRAEIAALRKLDPAPA